MKDSICLFLLELFICDFLCVQPLLSVAAPHRMEAPPQACNKNTAKTRNKPTDASAASSTYWNAGCQLATRQSNYIQIHPSAPHQLCATRPSRLYFNATGNHCSILTSVDTFHSDVSLPLCLCLTWVSCQLLSLHASWGSLHGGTFCVFLLTDHEQQTLLTRPVKGGKAREEFATVFLSDKYRWTLFFSLLWGCFTTGLNSSPVSSTPLHFSRVVCLRQFIIHSSFPLLFM